MGGPQSRSGQVRKISPPSGFDPRTVQPVDSRYTDYATRPTFASYTLTFALQLRKKHGKNLYNTEVPTDCRAKSRSFKAISNQKSLRTYDAHAL